MRLFHYRPLFLCCFVFMSAAGCGYFLIPQVKPLFVILLIGLSLLCLIAGTVTFLFLSNRHIRQEAPSDIIPDRTTPVSPKSRLRVRAHLAVRPLFLASVACFLASLALLQSFLYFDAFRIIPEPDESLSPSVPPDKPPSRVTGTIIERKNDGSHLTTYALYLTSIDHQPVHGKALLVCHYTSDLQAGFSVDMAVSVCPLEQVVTDGYDTQHLIGDGFRVGLISPDEQTVLVTDTETRSLLVTAGQLRRRLAGKLHWQSEDGNGLAEALFLGEKRHLKPETRRNFSRAGVAHLLAISGLHMTLLFGLSEWLMACLTVPRKIRAVLLGFSSFAYLLLLGFPPSATRAVCMLGMTYLSYLISARADTLTSLGLAGMLILLVSPSSVADIGFWMSFSAAFCLLTVMPLFPSPGQASSGKGKKGRFFLKRTLYLLSAGILTGVVAMTGTLWLTATPIGRMNWLSPLSTLLLTPLCAIVLFLSPLTLLSGSSGIGIFFGHCLSSVCLLMDQLAERLASPSWVVVSLRNAAILPVAVLTVFVLLLLLTIRLPERKRPVILLVPLIGWLCIGGVLGGTAFRDRNQIRVSYLQPSTYSELLVGVHRGQAFICDFSNTSHTSLYAAVREADLCGATEIGALLLTDYHACTPGTLADLLPAQTVRSLFLPRPTDEKDYYLMLGCLEKARLAHVPVHLYESGEELTVFGQGKAVIRRTSIPRSTKPLFLATIRFGDDRLTYCAASVFESDLKEAAMFAIPGSHTVIFGQHGPVVKQPYGDIPGIGSVHEIIFPEKGQAAAYFHMDSWPDPPPRLWLGQKRLRFSLSPSPVISDPGSSGSGFTYSDSSFTSPGSVFVSSDSGFTSLDSGFTSSDSGFTSPDSGFTSSDSGFISPDS